MKPETRAFVCGFGDVKAGLCPQAWDLGEPGALILTKGAGRQATYAVEPDLETTTVQITADTDTVEATLAPERTLIEHPAADNPVEFKATAALAEVRSKGGDQTFECAGQISEWVGEPLEGAATLRHLAIGGPPGSQLIATARGLSGADGHGSERTVGWLLSGDSGVPYEETLISTQYDRNDEP